MKLRYKAALERLVKFFRLNTWIRFLMLCILVGVSAGLVGALFDYGLTALYQVLFVDLLSQIKPGGLAGLALLLFIPGCGLFLAGALAWKWAPEARGSGTDAVVKAFHRERGAIRPQVPWCKGLCTILTIGSGGSAGKEGPTAQIGAGIGSAIAKTLKLSVRDRRLLMLAGCAGGLGAVLRAPLGGALFTAEVLYREPDFEHDAVIPSVISSVTAYSVFSALRGPETFLHFGRTATAGAAVRAAAPSFPSAGGHMLGELVHYALLSLWCALAAWLFVKGVRFIRERIFARLPLPVLVQPALGGIALGGLTAFLMLTLFLAPDQILGEGRVYMDRLIAAAQAGGTEPEPAAGGGLAILLAVLAAKIVATGLTVYSGASGGLLFPMLLAGALTGAAYAGFWQDLPWLPQAFTLTPEARAGMLVVGMGGVFCACTKTPIASLVLISEMSGSYALVVPLMLCCASSYLLCTSFVLDDEQVPGLADSPAHRGDFLVNVLEGLRVAHALTGHAKPETIPADLPLDKILERLKHSQVSTYPIVDAQGCLVGIFSLHDIRQVMNEQTIGNLVVAGDLGTTQVSTVTPETSLSEALRLFSERDIDELPVVEEGSAAASVPRRPTQRIARPRGLVGTRRVVAMLTRQDLISAYRKRLQELEAQGVQESQGRQVLGDAQVSAYEKEEHPSEDLRPWRSDSVPRDASQVDVELLAEPPEDSSSKSTGKPGSAAEEERERGAG